MISLLKRLLPAVFKRGHQAAAEQRLEQRDLAEEGRTEGMDKDGDDGDKHGDKDGDKDGDLHVANGSEWTNYQIYQLLDLWALGLKCKPQLAS